MTSAVRQGMRGNPESESLLDVLGEWPIYVGVKLAILGAILGLMTLPHLRKPTQQRGDAPATQR